MLQETLIVFFFLLLNAFAVGFSASDSYPECLLLHRRGTISLSIQKAVLGNSLPEIQPGIRFSSSSHPYTIRPAELSLGKSKQIAIGLLPENSIFREL